MLSNRTTIPLNVNLSSTTPLNNLLSHHYFIHTIRQEIEFMNFEMLGLGLSKQNGKFVVVVFFFFFMLFWLHVWRCWCHIEWVKDVLAYNLYITLFINYK